MKNFEAQTSEFTTSPIQGQGESFFDIEQKTKPLEMKESNRSMFEELRFELFRGRAEKRD